MEMKSVPTASPEVKMATVKPAVRVCDMGQVALSDGTCKVIDMEIIDELVRVVEARKATLEALRGKYESLHEPECTSCPAAATYYEARPKLIEAHREYRSALGFLLNAMAAMKGVGQGKEDGGVTARGNIDSGPEFVRGKKKLRPHCEPWTASETAAPSSNICGIVCRNQPSCVGFATDPQSRWCVWFDAEKPTTESLCGSVGETEFIKKKQVAQNSQMWTAMEKIRVFDKAISEALQMAELQADTANKTFMGWWSSTRGNSSAKFHSRQDFAESLKDYAGTILDVAKIREQYLILQKAAYSLASAEAQVSPPLSEPASLEHPETKATMHPKGLHQPVAAKPVPLQWKDFPNSQDTAWSKLHPDCPMGTPCVCDCKCRGPPPQNFVEPPPTASPPCPPPPPLPNPMMLSPVPR